MKVIENNHCVRAICPGCTSVLGVFKEDIRYDDSGHGPEFSAPCVQCGMQLVLNGDDIPTSWMCDLGVI